VTEAIRRKRVGNWHNLGCVRDLTTPLSNAARSSVLTAPVVVSAGDPGSTRLVYAMVAGLTVIGVALVLLAIWLLRQTRYDPPVLAPLERMGDRDWRRQRDPATQRRVLDEVRPEGAQPFRPESSPPSIDEEFDLPARPVASMSDLAAPEADSRSQTPQGIVRLDAIGLDDDEGTQVEGDAFEGEAVEGAGVQEPAVEVGAAADGVEVPDVDGAADVAEVSDGAEDSSDVDDR
jgi:hypothetical protein